jgi:hypothetical protein
LSARSFDNLGVLSEVVELLPTPDGRGLARAKLCIVPPATGSTPFEEGDWLDVTVSARVYDIAPTQLVLPQVPRAQGAEVRMTARRDWALVDLELPPVPFNRYLVVAKVYSCDPGYRKRFDPSECHASAVEYGFR